MSKFDPKQASYRMMEAISVLLKVHPTVNTMDKLCASIGVTGSLGSHWRTRGIAVENIIRLCELYKINIKHILWGTGSMFDDTTYEAVMLALRSTKQKPITKAKKKPNLSHPAKVNPLRINPRS